MKLFSRGQAEGEIRPDKILEPTCCVAHCLFFAVCILDASLLCGHRLFHNKVIEIPARVYSSLLVKTTLLHIIVYFIDQLFAHV